MTTKEKILAALRQGPMNDAEIAQAVAAPVPSVRRCRGELLVAKLIEAHVDHADGSMTWRLPQPTAAVTPKTRTAAGAKFDIKSRPPDVRLTHGNITYF